ncbi:MAG: gliding motility-associated C-terminal domain-containing protein, partial [Prevotellaceae bacterium]|nr:gliding motility-associated C-terminal domain-containing protein [Prevotellaceae bacterium]
GTIHNFTTSTLADGRTRCTYTADVEAEAVAYITYTGSFAAMPAGGSYASSVGVVPPPSFEDQNESDNYSLFTGCITYPLTPDTIVAAKGGAVRFDALWNDSLPCPAVNATTGIIPGAGQHRGEATINPDRTFTYRAHTAGVDSFAYYVVCNDDSSTTKVYVLVLSPLAQTYVACPGATVTLGFTPLAGVTCNWYAHAAGGAILRSATTMSVVKGSASDLGTWWVEPVYDGVVFPRYRVDLEASDHCGATTTTGCAANGTLLFKEDFGGNAPSDPSVKPTGIPQVVGYTYLPDLNGQGVYTIAKQSPNYTHAESWYLLDDHTFPDDPSRGYLAGFDASAAPGQFYEYRINDLCVGTRLYFSAWLASLISNLTHVDKSNLIFVVENTAGDVLARFHTGNLPDADPRWKNYGFAFTAPESSVVLKILNNGAGSSGNDFVMDDIEIRFCASEVALTTRDTSVCAGAALAFDGHYTDNGLFGDHLAARWEFSLTGAIHVPDDWTAVAGSETTVTDGVVNSHYALAGLTPANAGYYRLVVASPDNIANFNCRAMSPVVRIQVDTVAPPPTVYSADPQAFCTGGAALLTADAPDAVSYQWYFNNTPLAGATADTCVAAATGSYTLRIRNLHDCPSAMSPAWTITVHPFPDVPTLAAAAATFCAGQSVALTAGAAGGLVYYWFRDNTPIDTTTPDPVLHTSVPGTYRVETGGAGGCRAAAPSNEITLTALPAPDTPTLDATQTDFCAGQSATLVAAAAGADEYEWYKDALLIDALTAPVRTVYETGLYSVKARNRYRCYAPHDAEPLMITRHDLPRTPIIVADGPPFYLDWDYTLSLQTTEHAVEYHWYKNAASTGVRDSLFPLPLIARAAAGAYTVEALSEYGCRAASEPFVVALEASPLFIPNIFTPNNDGVNDHFRITGLDNYDGNDLLVINKRGKTVFSAVNYRNTWYGDNQPDDVYYFRLRLREKSGDITLHEGYVHIKRK